MEATAHKDKHEATAASHGLIAGLIRFSMQKRRLVLGVALLISAIGVWAFNQMPIDAYPDISAQQVLIISQFPGRAPEEIERQVTIPIELAMGSVPNVDVIRSRTIFGLSVVEIVFEENVEKYFARQRVQEKLTAMTFPDGVETELGPLATAYGEIYRYELKSEVGHDLMELRTINDWVVIPRLGFDFLPYLDEGTIWVRANFPEGTALEKTAAYSDQMRGLIREFPEVSFVISQAGRNDSGTDPFVPSRVEMLVGLKPMEQWTVPTKRALIAALGQRLRTEFPTTRFNFTQPIIDSVTEVTNGTSADLAVEFSGADSDVLIELGRKTVDLLREVPGALDVNIEQEGPQPQLVIRPDRARCARYDVHIDDVNKLINTALGGEPVGTLYEGERRFGIAVRFDWDFLKSPESIARLPVHTKAGVPVTLYLRPISVLRSMAALSQLPVTLAGAVHGRR